MISLIIQATFLSKLEIPYNDAIKLEFLGTISSYTFEFKDCGSTDFIIHEIDIQPMPIRYPGVARITMIADIIRPICKYQML